PVAGHHRPGHRPGRPAAVRQPAVWLVRPAAAGQVARGRAPDRGGGRLAVLRPAQAGHVRRAAADHALAALPGLGVRRTGAVPAREAPGAAAAGLGGAAVLPGLRVRVFPGAAGGVQLPHRDHARRRGDDDRHQRLPELRTGDLPGLRHQLRAAGGPGDPGGDGLGDAGAAARMARLRGGGHVRAGRDHHPAGRGLAADAGDPDVPAVRGRDHRRARGGAQGGRRGRRRRMSAPPAQAAGLLRRYLAWSLDMLVPALAALALCGGRIARAATDAARALDALARALAEAMIDLLARGVTPLDLARDWLQDPARREETAALAPGITTIADLPAGLTPPPPRG